MGAIAYEAALAELARSGQKEPLAAPLVRKKNAI